MRVYLAATLPLLAAWIAAGAAAPTLAAGVTPGLREAYSEGDLEELEWVAQQAAARASLRLLAADPAAPRQRVLLAVDVDDSRIMMVPSGTDPAELVVAGSVDRAHWASALLDAGLVQADTATIVAAVDALNSGTPAVQLQDLLDDAEAIELGWWGIQELTSLLE